MRDEIKKVIIFLGAIAFVNGILSLEVANPVILSLYVIGIVFAFLYLFRADRRILDLIAFFTFMASALAVAVYRLPSQTDEESLVLYASYLFRHGVNPYTVNLLSAYKMFPVAEPVVTVTLTPNYYVDTFGYPALYFELATIAYPQIVTLSATFLLYLFLRMKGKEDLFFVLVLIYGTYSAFTGGSFDIVCLLLAVVSLSLTGWKRTTLLAISGDIKQFTLLYLPFIWKDYWGKWKELAKNVIIPLFAFLVPNIPFISKTWAFDVLGPLTQPIANQGISISLLSAVGVPLPHISYTIAFIVMYAGLLYLYKKNTNWKWLLPALIWLVSWRDLNYFMFYIAVWVASWWETNE